MQCLWLIIFVSLFDDAVLGILLFLLSHSVVSYCLQPYGLQHTRLPCPSPSPGVCSNSCPSSWWCYPTVSFSVDPSLALNLSQHQCLFQWVSLEELKYARALRPHRGLAVIINYAFPLPRMVLGVLYRMCTFVGRMKGWVSDICQPRRWKSVSFGVEEGSWAAFNTPILTPLPTTH